VSARLIGVGTGPGDPELMTLKAVRALEQAEVVAWFAKAGNNSNARASASRFLRADIIELALLYPVTTEHPVDSPAYQSAIASFFDESAARIARQLDANRTVVVLSEGDPLFFGSYMHIHKRLCGRYPVEVIPGVTAMSACWSAAGMPLVRGEEVLSVIPGSLPQAELTRRFALGEAAVVMKVGRNLAKIRRALVDAQRLDDAMYVGRASMERQEVVPLAHKTDDHAPYFAIVLVGTA
jgi:precorrin-2/cobalt-factor-2 C20-methyltransferase